MSLGENPFLAKTETDCETVICGEGRTTFEARDSRPSLLPVSTLYLPPLLCRKIGCVQNFQVIIYVCTHLSKKEDEVKKCYQGNSISCSHSYDISTRHNSWAGCLHRILSCINDIIASYT